MKQTRSNTSKRRVRQLENELEDLQDRISEILNRGDDDGTDDEGDN